MSFSQDQIAKHIVGVKKWNPQQSKPEDSFSYIDLSAVDKEKKIINLSEVPEILCIDAPSRAKQLVKTSDILVSTVRPNLNGVAIVPKSLDEATASTGYCVLRANNTTLNPNYLFYWVQTPAFIADMMSKATGANYPAVSDKTIKESKIPLPPLTEQQKIAEILDAADALRQKDQQLIAHYEQLGQSLFLEMFGDPVVNPKGWEQERLGNLVENLDGQRVPVKSSDRKNMQGSYPYYGASGIIDYVDNYLFDHETLLVAEDGANLLSRSLPVAFIAKGLYWVNNHAHVLKYNGKVSLEYLRFTLENMSLDMYITGSAQPKLNQKSLNSILINTPPIHLQNQFAERIQAIEAQKQQAQQNLEQSEKLFNSLLQRAFKGELTA